jgi:hypothetical protein
MAGNTRSVLHDETISLSAGAKRDLLVRAALSRSDSSKVIESLA